jgi:DNA-binding MarR family transcriptional regulator
VAGKRIFDPTSEAFRLSSSPFYLIAHADFIYHENMEAVLAKRDVTKSTYRILTVLRDYQPCRMTDLADMALIKRTTVSRIVNRMSEDGLVETEHSAVDSRAIEVRLSQAGRALLDTLTPLIAPLFDHAMRGLDHQELQRLVATLQIISANLGHASTA